MICCPHKRGFTLPELIISVAIIMMIFGFAGVNLLRIVPQADLNQVFEAFVADAKSQQYRAMLGESSGVLQEDYGIKIDSGSYTLFRGNAFAPGDADNYTVTFPQTITATTGLPETASGAIVFSALTGEIRNFAYDHPEYYSVSFTGPDSSQITVRFNKLGNVYYVNKN